MTDRLKVDVDLLLDTGDDLADTIREFSREWTNRREKMKESIALFDAIVLSLHPVVRG